MQQGFWREWGDNLSSACNHLCLRFITYYVMKTDFTKNNKLCQVIDFSSDGKCDMSDLAA